MTKVTIQGREPIVRESHDGTFLSATNEQLNSEESGYVIERYINGELRYWEGRYVDDRAFIANASDAVRFSRESDGAVVLAWLLGGHGRITQHVWTKGV